MRTLLFIASTLFAGTAAAAEADDVAEHFDNRWFGKNELALDPDESASNPF